MNAIKTYLEEVMTEMRKVNWPNQEELAQSTFVTIIGTVIIAGYIYGVDQVVSAILEFIYQ